MGKRLLRNVVLVVVLSVLSLYAVSKTLPYLSPTATTPEYDDEEEDESYAIPHKFLNSSLSKQWSDLSAACHSKTVTVLVTLGHGSYALRCLLLSVHYAMHHQRTLFIARSAPNELVWESFFLPISPSCTPPPSASYIPRSEDIPGSRILPDSSERDYSEVPDLWIDGGGCPLWNKISFFRSSPQYYMATAAELVLKLNPDFETELKQILSVFPSWTIGSYHAIHIRRGDKVYGSAAEARYKSAEDYCKKLEELVGTTNITDPVFVAADTIGSIHELEVTRPKWKVWYVNTPKYEELRKGNFTHANFWKWKWEDRVYWYKMFVAELTMMRHARNFVGTGTSNVWQLVVALRGGESSSTLDKRRSYDDFDDDDDDDDDDIMVMMEMMGKNG